VSKATKGIIAAVVVIVLVGGGFLVWDRVLRDKSDPTANVNAIGGTPSGTSAAGSSGGASSGSPDGSWKIQQGDTVFVGYRVHEIFAQGALSKTANGRSTAVTGTMTVAGDQVTAVELTADTTKLKSDESRRDGAISSRGLETATFPEATFKLTSPVAFGSVSEGQQTTVTAKGDLTLHGQTKSVEVPLTAVWTGSEIKVATQGEGLPIAFADYGMTSIEVPGFVTTDDHGTLELQLLFVKA